MDFIEKHQRPVFYAALAVLVLLAYSNVYDNSFLYDDISIFLGNNYIKSWSHLGDIFTSSLTSGAGTDTGFYRPLQNIAYLIVHSLFGMEEIAFHALNVLLHTVNSWLILALAKKLGLRPWPAFFAALVWAAHPIHTEAVTYMSATADPLHTMFILLGLLAWEDKNPKAMCLSLLYFALGLLSKEATVVFPGLLVICLFVASRGSLPLAAYVRIWPCVLVIGAYFLIRFLVFNSVTYDFIGASFTAENNPYAASMWVRFLSFLAVVPQYFGLLLQPQGLHMDRGSVYYTNPFYPEVIGGLLILLAAVACVVAALRRPKDESLLLAGFAGAWFFAAYFPGSGILLPVNYVIIEHWMYLPSIGLFLGIAELFSKLLEHRKRLDLPVAGAAALMACISGLSTWQQNMVWDNPVSFYSNIIKYEPYAVQAHNNLGITYESIGELGKAYEEYKAAIAISEKLPSGQVIFAHTNIARLYMRRKDYVNAEKHLQATLAINPNAYAAVKKMGELYRLTNRPKEAQKYETRLQELKARGGKYIEMLGIDPMAPEVPEP